MWNQKCKIIPVIIGAIGLVTKCFRKNLEAIPRKTFNRFTTKNKYTWNITHDMDSTVV